jgi:hypothetical protein
MKLKNQLKLVRELLKERRILRKKLKSFLAPNLKRSVKLLVRELPKKAPNLKKIR